MTDNEGKKLTSLINQVDELVRASVTSSSPEFTAWKMRVRRFLLRVFGEDSLELNEFDKESEDFLSLEAPEVIFSMGTSALKANVLGGQGDWVISDDLYKSYAGNDLRKSIFFCRKYNIPTYGLIYGKNYYSDNNYLAPLVSDNFLMRSAEAYLNLAESAACLGGEYTAEALDAYNELRRNRFEKGYTDVTGLSGKILVDSIREERRRELCLEGHRWFDLRRYMVNEDFPYEKTLTNNYLEVEFSFATFQYEVTASGLYQLPPHDPAWTLPIPQSELDANYGMQDNVRGPRESIETSTN